MKKFLNSFQNSLTLENQCCSKIFGPVSKQCNFEVSVAWGLTVQFMGTNFSFSFAITLLSLYVRVKSFSKFVCTVSSILSRLSFFSTKTELICTVCHNLRAISSPAQRFDLEMKRIYNSTHFFSENLNSNYNTTTLQHNSTQFPLRNVVYVYHGRIA